MVTKIPVKIFVILKAFLTIIFYHFIWWPLKSLFLPTKERRVKGLKDLHNNVYNYIHNNKDFIISHCRKIKGWVITLTVTFYHTSNLTFSLNFSIHLKYFIIIFKTHCPCKSSSPQISPPSRTSFYIQFLGLAVTVSSD